MGEVTAAVVAGALSTAEGLRVIATRSRLMSRLSGQGAVALIELDPEAASALIAYYAEVTLAGYASPRQSVIAGLPEQVDAVIAAVSAQNRFARRVNMEVASHTALMDPILPDLRTALADLTLRIPTIPFLSTVADPTTAPLLDAEYWVANVRNPVRFSQAVAAAAAEHATFIEVSPHPLLTHAISDTLGPGHHHSIATLQRDTHDTLTFHTSLNATHTTHPPHTQHPPGPHPALPTTPWHHTRHWIPAPKAPKPQRHNGIPVQSVPASQDGDGALNDWFYEPTWRMRELLAVDTSSEDSWLVLADADVGAEWGQVLGIDSRIAVLAPSVLDEDGNNAALLNALVGTDNVLYAPSVSSAHLDVAAAYRLFNVLRRLAATLAGMTSPPKLFVVTRNAQPIDEGDRANPAHAVLWGLGRTLALEHPEIWGGVIDVDDSVPPELIVQYVLAEVRATDGEDQVVYRAGLRHVPRLERRTSPAASVATLRRDSSHLVIGATGNIGPHLIRQLSNMGATTIVAVSRHAGSRLEELARSLALTGTNLIEVAADAADEAAMTALFQRFGADLPPLEGIYLAAMAGGPVLLRDMTDDDVNAMFRPKLDALSVLHKLSLKTPVRQFVLFSSISGLLGSRWLGHYTATSAFLDTFAFARRALGLPATVVNWGLWKSLADAQPETYVGLQPMADEVAIRALAGVIGPDSAVRSAVVAADWSRLAGAYRMRGALRVVDDLVSDTNVDTHRISPTTRTWSQMPAENIVRELEIGLRDILARELGMPASALDTDRPFPELGVDSMMAMTVLREAKQLGIELSPTMLWNHPTVSSLAAYLAEMLSPQEESEEGSDDGAADMTADSASSVLDALFNSVESAPASSESGI
jgi:acyl transferase domain-containing protein